jgi:SAM-dependent methyltransferase
MDKKTVRQLNRVNKEFYLQSQEYFNRTRQYYWSGWEKLLPYLKGKSLKALDVGCGNGRFGKFLKENIKKVDYTGIDNNEYLLKQAKKNVAGAKLIKQDVLEKWRIGNQKFDVIAIIALLHHVPSFENRVKLLQKAKKHLMKNGVIILTLWQFNKLKRLREKIVPWNEFKKLTDLDIDLNQLEKNDYIFDWKKGPTAYRFIHLIEEKELNQILQRLNMQLVADFEADAKEGRGNRYIILKSAA